MRKQPGVKNDRPNYSTGTFLHIQLMVSGFKVLSEIGRFLVALIFLLLTFGSAISVLEHPYFETRLGNIFNIYIYMHSMYVLLPARCRVLGSCRLFQRCDIYIYHSVWAKEMRDIPPRCCIYKRSVVVVDEGGWILHHLKHA